MSNVTEIDDFRPHRSVTAKCQTCRCSWTAVFPTYTDRKGLKLECPNCCVVGIPLLSKECEELSGKEVREILADQGSRFK
jgi:hypothetical protein